MRSLPGRLAISLGVGSIVAGRAGDAPGAVLLGLLLVAGAPAWG